MTAVSHSLQLPPAAESIAHEVTRRIVATVKPQRVVLFGSAVGGHWTADSDLDMLVIMRGNAHRRRLAQQIYGVLHGVGLPVDVIVVTEQDVAEYADKPGNIMRPALQTGRVLYEAS
ncbi:MAG: nucleotidyltransferase domain-containing protein [Chloroflexota bacterium]